MSVIGRLFVIAILSTVPLHSASLKSWSTPIRSLQSTRGCRKAAGRTDQSGKCSHKADEAKVLPRDRTANIQHCLDETVRWLDHRRDVGQRAVASPWLCACLSPEQSKNEWREVGGKNCSSQDPVVVEPIVPIFD